MTPTPRTDGVRSAGMVIGLLVGCTGPILAFGQKKHSADHILDIDVALPWIAGLGLAGALIVVVSCWSLPRRATGGAALAVIMLVVVAIGLVITVVRLSGGGADAGMPALLSIAGQLIAAAILASSAVQCARKPEHPPSRR